MKLNRVNDDGIIYQVTPKVYKSKEYNLIGYTKRICAFEGCVKVVSKMNRLGFCLNHRPSRKGITGIKMPKYKLSMSMSILRKRIGYTCITTGCNNKTHNVSNICGRCFKRIHWRPSKLRPKAPFKQGDLAELERIVALENRLLKHQTAR